MGQHISHSAPSKVAKAMCITSPLLAKEELSSGMLISLGLELLCMVHLLSSLRKKLLTLLSNPTRKFPFFLVGIKQVIHTHKNPIFFIFGYCNQPTMHADAGEWWNVDTEAVIRQALQTGAGPNVSDAYTFNGLPGPLYNCSQNGTHLRILPNFGTTN